MAEGGTVGGNARARPAIYLVAIEARADAREIDHVAAVEDTERSRIAHIRHEVAQQRLDDCAQRSVRQHGVAEVEAGDAEAEPSALWNGLEIAEFDQGLDQPESRATIEIGPCGNFTQVSSKCSLVKLLSTAKALPTEAT